MENNNRYSKYAAVIALLISVIGVSLGFAAYSNTVQIQAAADVRLPSVKVGELSVDPDEQQDGTVTPTTTGGATAEAADLTDEGIENIRVHFTAPGQSATYSFYGVNTSAFVAYLNSVVFGTKACSPSTTGNPATASYVTDACNDIVMTISAGSDSWTETENNIDSHSVSSESNEPIAVTIEYLDGGNTADGDFDVDFGTSTITYGTVD